MRTLEIVVGIETLPLHQLWFCVHSRTVDKVAKNMGVLHMWPDAHVVHKLAVVPSSERIMFSQVTEA